MYRCPYCIYWASLSPHESGLSASGLSQLMVPWHWVLIGYATEQQRHHRLILNKYSNDWPLSGCNTVLELQAGCLQCIELPPNTNS